MESKNEELGECYERIHELEYQVKKLELENRILRDRLNDLLGGEK